MSPTDAQQSENLEFGLYFGIASTIDVLMMSQDWRTVPKKEVWLEVFPT